MVTGTVKWFNTVRGYGFIVPKSGGDDVYVHYSEIKMEGYRALISGEAVEFDVEEGPKGPEACHLRPWRRTEAA